MGSTAEHPNTARAHRYLDAHASGDVAALGTFLGDDIVWRVGGSHPLSGAYRGKAAVLGYLERAATETGGTISLRADSVLASDRHLALFLDVTASRGERTLAASMTQIVRLDAEGQWQEFWALSDDQDAIDEFWS